jgi:hypothetical protein
MKRVPKQPGCAAQGNQGDPRHRPELVSNMGHPIFNSVKYGTTKFQLTTHAPIPKLSQPANQELFKEKGITKIYRR